MTDTKPTAPTDRERRSGPGGTGAGPLDVPVFDALRPSPATSRPKRARNVVVVLVLAAALTAIAFNAPPASPSALDPRSTTPSGTKALMFLMIGLGAKIDIGPTMPSSVHGVALLLRDRLDPTDRAALLRWVDDGGELVTTDPPSSLSEVRLDTSTQDATVPPANGRSWPACDLSAIAGVHNLDLSGAPLLHAGPGQVGCLPAGQGSYLVARHQGSGIVVVVATPDLWTNGELGAADDSVLAASLLVPSPGTAVTVIGASLVGSGRQTLLGLISPHLIEAVWGLIGALVLVVAWRSRRLGRPVVDRVPVDLPGSALVVATGHLLQEGGHRGSAAAVLRDELRRSLSERTGVPADLPDETIAAVAAAPTGVPAQALLDALTGPAPGDDTALVELAQKVERTRRQVSRVQ